MDAPPDVQTTDTLSHALHERTSEGAAVRTSSDVYPFGVVSWAKNVPVLQRQLQGVEQEFERYADALPERSELLVYSSLSQCARCNGWKAGEMD